MRRSLALLILPLAVLAGCSPVPPAPTPAESSPSSTPTATETAAPVEDLDPDVLLVVTATATAENGAVLDLRMEVHKSTAWNDSAAPERPALMDTQCDGYLDATVYGPNLWSFLLVNVSAAADPATPAWPADKRIRLWPGSVVGDELVALASDGFLVEDQDVDDATPACVRDRYLYGAGDGTLIAGIQGDTDEVGAAGQFTRWANQRYGFVAREVAGQTAESAGIFVTDCSFLVTPAGVELNGDADWWGSTNDESNCYTGSTVS